ncbi:MAG: hypothetical protein SF339_07660 [Blastocatellia bacterium]|nr:hypothetical protein [Blastocatellia bacterium]
MKLFGNFALTLLLTLGLAAAGRSQSQTETPESVAQAYVAATQQGDWPKATSYMHPDALAGFKKAFAPVFDAKDPKAAAGIGAIFGINSREEFDALTGGQLLEKLMGTLGGAMPGLNQLMKQSSFTILGRVPEGEDLVHLVCRAQVPMGGMQLKEAPDLTKNVTFSKMEVVSLRRYESTWRVILSGEIEGMAQMFANMAGMFPQGPPPPPPPPPARPPATKKPAKPARKP